MRTCVVIQLSRLNGSQFYLNAEHVQAVESTPDTHVLLTNGQLYVVLETADDIARAMIRYQQDIRQSRPVQNTPRRLAAG